jgi:hypothetical protein
MISIKPVSKNAHFSIHDNLYPDSNVTDESNPHPAKQLSDTTSTDAGIWTNFKLVFEKLRPTAEMRRIRPSVTINRGQNSLAIFQKIWDFGFVIEIEIGIFTGQLSTFVK